MKTEPETITVTKLREQTREILENACFRGKRYRVERAGQEMVVILGVEEYQRLTVTPPQHLAHAVNSPGDLR